MGINYKEAAERAIGILSPLAALGFFAFGAVRLRPLTPGSRLRGEYRNPNARDDQGNKMSKPVEEEDGGITLHHYASSDLLTNELPGRDARLFQVRETINRGIQYAVIFFNGVRLAQLNRSFPRKTIKVAGHKFQADFWEVQK